MKNLLTLRCTAATALLLGCWTGAYGQMLGSPVAEVLLGRPLEMTLPARFASADAGDECVQADVFYGESRVNASNVRATVTGPADQRRVRIESTTPIDEPIVTVSVRAGCRNTITRNYTLLPEYPSERLLAALDARTALASAAAAAPLRMATTTAAAPGPRKAPPRATVVARAEREAAPARGTRASARAPRGATVVAKGPRLQLEPMEMPERQALLRTSTSLADPGGDASRRATAALLWQAINADPQEVLRTTVMIRKLEQDLAQLRQSSNQTRAEMASLRQRLEQAQPWYLSPVLVQVLALLVLAAATAAGMLWHRTRGLRAPAGQWYVPPVEPAPAAAAEPVVAREEPQVQVPEPMPVGEIPELQPVPVTALAPLAPAADEPAGDDGNMIEFELPAAAPAVRRGGTDGVLRVETLAATLEEVDFLRSLGLATDAMDLLKGYLQDSAAPAPLAYLELMRLCEQAEDPAAVATVRRRYAQAFGKEAPRLAQLTVEGGLDSLPELSTRITRAWGKADALEVIEDALFSVPTPAAPLTLHAGRDLLSLFDLALARATEGGGTVADAPLAPWAQTDAARAAGATLADAAEVDAGRDGIDIDLSAAAAHEAASLQIEPEQASAALRAQAESEAAARRAREEEDAFNAAMASERVPVSRY